MPLAPPVFKNNEILMESNPHNPSSSVPGRVLKRSALLCAVIGVVLFGVSLQKIEVPVLDQTPTQFSGQRAFDYMKDLSKGFPYRVTWSDQRKKAGDWIKSEFRKMGYTPQSQYFSEIIAGRRYTNLENIYVEKRGTKHPDEIIVMSGHYDVTDTTIEGAMDDASGVGVVMELARIFANIPTDRTLIFMAADSEEFGALWGSRAFAREFPHARQIVAVENFDFVGPEKQTNIITLCDGLKSGYTPLWLREIALASVRAAGTQATELTNLMEAIERAVTIPSADHGSYLAEGIPAFTFVGQDENFAYAMAHYHHTPHDTVEIMQVPSFDAFGKAAEIALRTLDKIELPKDFRNSSYWKITSHTYLSGTAALILQLLAFIPFLAFSITRFAPLFTGPSRDRAVRLLKNEAKNAGLVLLSLLAGYAVLLILPQLHVIPQYEVFPATQKSLILYSPDFMAIFIVLATVAGAYFILDRLFSEPDDKIEDANIRQSLHFFILALIIFAAMLKNSFLASLALLPPAYFWSALRARPKKSRSLNLLLIAAGSITLISVLIALSNVFFIGVTYWYVFLAVSYGLISAYSIVLFVMALTIMVRLTRAFVLSRS